MTWRETIQFVIQRAGERCEYCRMHQSLQGASFHLEHVIPKSRGGGSALDNYAWCCPSCNLHKADRIDASDPVSADIVRLFNPRGDNWTSHFAWNGEILEGKTAVGRATIAALILNHPRRLQIRRAERMFDLFPPS